MSDKEYISCADTAKMVRKTLAAEFPGIKFSVRSRTYSMGASMDVEWMDGPSGKTVDSKIQQFAGASFDAMQDLKEYHESIHPETGKPVRWGADYIFTQRHYSTEFLQGIVTKVAKEWGQPEPAIKSDSMGAHLITTTYTPESEHLRIEILRTLAVTDCNTKQSEPSADKEPKESKPAYTYKDLMSGKIHKTSGKFVQWQRGGILNAWGAVFQHRRSVMFVPRYLLTAESLAKLPPLPAEPIVLMLLAGL